MTRRYDEWFPEAYDMHWTCKCGKRVLESVPYCENCGELRPVPKPEKPSDQPIWRTKPISLPRKE